MATNGVNPANPTQRPSTTPVDIQHVGHGIEAAIRTAVTDARKSVDFTALREQTVGMPCKTITSTKFPVDRKPANINFILALYKHGNPRGLSEPSIVLVNGGDRIFAAAVRTSCYGSLGKTSMTTTFSGKGCETEYEALKELFGVTKEAVRRAMELSRRQCGFHDWNQLMLG